VLRISDLRAPGLHLAPFGSWRDVRERVLLLANDNAVAHGKN